MKIDVIWLFWLITLAFFLGMDLNTYPVPLLSVAMELGVLILIGYMIRRDNK